MKFVDPNYEPPENNQKKFANGSYQVRGVRWFTRDTVSKQPVLVSQKDGKLVGRLSFILTDDEQGPPMSLELKEMGLLAKAFGVDNLPTPPADNQPGMISAYMQQIEDLIKKSGNIINVTVENEWVNANGVEGMVVPKGNFYFYLSDITPKDSDGKPYYLAGQYGDFFFAEFTVVAGEGGQPTPYKGATFSELVNYAVKIYENTPDWERTDSGNISKPGKKLSDLVRMTCPEIDFTPEDPTNILKTWHRQLPNPPKILKGTRIKNDKNKRIQLVWDTLEPIYGFQVAELPKEGEDDIHQKARKLLVSLFDEVIDTPSTNGNMELTEQGVLLAKKIISPLRPKVKAKNIRDLTWEEVDLIMSSMKDEYPQTSTYYDQLMTTGIRLDEPVKEEEWGDSPF